MTQPQGAELSRIRTRREEIRRRWLHEGAERPATTARGVHHVAFICRDVEETVRFYHDLLGFPLVEMVENRDYRGSTHFFFDIGNRNLLGFFDFPGHEHPPAQETVGGVQHLALSMDAERHAAARQALDEAGVSYQGPERGIEESLYLRDPNGVPLELYRERPGVFDGRHLVPGVPDDPADGT
ncbi:VOC family protein [Streptomyces alkaliterrae]|uniref:VOC family protein n=1 Tax=Streptomyces alkaliterrae TaxID=2213162 RepID=A0A5P0YTY5_9ACTN|nr:VOC family protein [Streptomyces alkaliterrae]MBB1254863.1 VOC family protein [Streptomyces alkaliterrae]MBB1259662.1 VOC family protein [Streptomyces alkaliterrae]MQS03087.1 VOC family protein [Streptomyces alkaliterrae]